MSSATRARRVYERALRALSATPLGGRTENDDVIELVREAFGLRRVEGSPCALRTPFADLEYPPGALSGLLPPRRSATEVPRPVTQILAGELEALRVAAAEALHGDPAAWPAELERLGSFVAVDTDYSRTSLYEATRIVAAVASAFEGGLVTRVHIEFSRIQAFIATTASRRALKVLRGRSAFIDLYIDALAHRLASVCGTGATAIASTGAGKAELFIPPSRRDVVLAEFEFARAYVVDRFQTDITLIVVALDEPPATKEVELQRALDDELSAPLGSLLPAFLQTENQDDLGLCAVCKHDRQVTTQPVGELGEFLDMCASCVELERFGGRLHAAVAIRQVGSSSMGSGPVLDLGFARYRIVTEPHEELSEVDYAVNHFAGAARRFWYANSRGENAEQLMWCAAQAPGGYVALLRADVDNLGRTIRKLREQRGGWLAGATLSSLIAQFFRIFGNGLLTEAVSFIYAGGDDVVAVGAWNQVCDLAVRLRLELRELLGVGDSAEAASVLDISAGLAFGKPETPLHRLAGMAADLEDAAKARPGKGYLGVSLGAADAAPEAESYIMLSWAEWTVARALEHRLLGQIDDEGPGRRVATQAFAHRLIVAGYRYRREGVIAFPSLAYALSRMPNLDRLLAADLLAHETAKLLAVIGTLISLGTRPRPTAERTVE